MKTKRLIKQNVWGNWNGYEAGRKVLEFGTDAIFAGYWLETGVIDCHAGYEDPEKYRELAYKGESQ